MHTDRCGNTREQKCAKGSGKEIEIQNFDVVLTVQRR